MRHHDYTPTDALITDYCDTDSKWGPLLFLRPARSEALTVVRCAMLALLPGVFLGLIGSILFRLLTWGLGRPALSVAAFPIVLTTAYFFVCRFLLAPAWNRRAKLLSNGRS
jgi:hypothetical protein